MMIQIDSEVMHGWQRRIKELEAQVARLEATPPEKRNAIPVTLLRYIVNSHPSLPVDDRIAASQWLRTLDGAQ